MSADGCASTQADLDAWEGLTPPGAKPTYWRERSVSVLLGLLGISVSLSVLFEASWPWTLWAQRTSALATCTASGVCCSRDLGLALAQALQFAGVASPGHAVLFASSLALPFCAFFLLYTTPKPRRPLARPILLLANPLVLGTFIAGFGWATLGALALFRHLAGLAHQPPHRGMPLTGAVIVLAFTATPGGINLLLPIAGTLWLCAPRQMVRADMRAFYALSFAPTLMVLASVAYLDMLEGNETAGSTLIANGGTYGLGFVAALATLCLAPALLPGGAKAGRGARATMAALLCLGLILGAPIPAPMFLAAAALAQLALSARINVPVIWQILSLLFSVAAALGVDHALFIA